jgi:hypothetical protein
MNGTSRSDVDDPARWVPSPALLGAFVEEGPTEWLSSHSVLDTGDPLEWITAWGEDAASVDTPIMRGVLGDRDKTAKEVEAA